MALESGTTLYIEFEGARGERRPIGARRRAPRRGIKVRVAVEAEAIAANCVYLLYRRGFGDMVLGASANRAVLEAAREKLGVAAKAYEIAAVPVLKPTNAELE